MAEDEMLSVNPALLFVVEPARLDTYELLCRQYSDESRFRVILDRRRRDPRDLSRAATIDRRGRRAAGRTADPRRGDGYIVIDRALS